MPYIHYFYILATAATISTILIPCVARLSVNIGGIDTPDPRKVHSGAIPRLGGIAIVCAVLFTIIYFCDIDTRLKGVLAGAMAIFLTGLVDDLSGITPRQKLIGEFIAAALVVLVGGISVRSLGNPLGLGPIKLGLLDIPFTIFAIMGMINAINLLDGLDGLAGGVCSICCVNFAVLAYYSHNMQLLALATALLGGLLGFMRYNSHPAIIFMGDSGSLFLGYCMGVFAILLVSGGKLPLSPYIPLLILGMPVIDTLVVMANRYRAGISTFQPDKTHLHHRLLDMGFGHRASVLIIYGITYLFSIIVVLFHDLSDGEFLLLLLVISISVYWLLHHLQHHPQHRKWITFQGKRTLQKTVLRTRVKWSNVLLTIVKYLVLSILCLPAFLPIIDNPYLPFLPLILLIASAVFFLLKSSWQNWALQCCIYVAGVLLIFTIENINSNDLLPGMELRTLSHILFILLLCFGVAKATLRNRTSKLITNPFDYLILLIVLSAPLLPHELTGRYHLLTVAAKSVILFLGFKLILMAQMQRNRKVLFAIMLASFTMLTKVLI